MTHPAADPAPQAHDGAIHEQAALRLAQGTFEVG
jgi:hypothetical protein